MFGYVFDGYCLVWQEKCSQRRSCWIYDSEWLGFTLFMIVCSACVISLLLLALAHYLYKPPTTEEQSHSSSGDEKSPLLKVSSIAILSHGDLKINIPHKFQPIIPHLQHNHE